MSLMLPSGRCRIPWSRTGTTPDFQHRMLRGLQDNRSAFSGLLASRQA